MVQIVGWEVRVLCLLMLSSWDWRGPSACWWQSSKSLSFGRIEQKFIFFFLFPFFSLFFEIFFQVLEQSSRLWPSRPLKVFFLLNLVLMIFYFSLKITSWSNIVTQDWSVLGYHPLFFPLLNFLTFSLKILFHLSVQFWLDSIWSFPLVWFSVDRMLVPFHKITFLPLPFPNSFKRTISRSRFLWFFYDILSGLQGHCDGWVKSLKDSTGFDALDVGNSQKPNFEIIQQSLNFAESIDLLMGEKTVGVFCVFGECLVVMRGDQRDNMMNDLLYFMPEQGGRIDSLVRRVGIPIDILFQRPPMHKDPRTEGIEHQSGCYHL